jgi:site-specific DNA recombinase
MKNETNEIVALYARVSTGLQDFELQMKDLKEEAKRRGVKVYKEYQDQITGSSEHREYLDQMIADAKAGRFTTLLIWKMDRLARNVRNGLNALHNIEETGVKVCFFKEPYLNTETPNYKMARNMLLMGAEMEHDAIKTRTRAAKINYIKEGKWPVPAYPPFGYNCVNYKLVIVENKAKVVRKIFDLYVKSNLSMRSIVNKLNDEKIPVPSPNSPRRIHFTGWRRDAVRNIIDNQIYTGKRMIGQKLGPIAEFKCPPIISEELFKEAQQKKEERFTLTYNPGRMKRDYLLRGLVRCAKCGFLMFPRFKRVGENKQEYYSYVGMSDETNVKRCKYCGMMGEIGLVEAIANGFYKSLFQSDEAGLNKIFGENEDSKQDVINLEEALAKSKQRKERVIEAFLSGDIDATSKRVRITVINNEIKIIEDKIQEFNQKSLTKSERDEGLRRLKKFFLDTNYFDNLMPVLNKEKSYKLVKALIQNMIIKSIYIDRARKSLAVHTTIEGMRTSYASYDNLDRSLAFNIYRNSGRTSDTN